jgi:hypothetical protein
MWGDPYGGWAFGARYLIPAYAILSIYIATLLTRFGKNRLFIFIFFIVLTYSVIINTLGAVTSNSNPPQIQAASLSELTHSKVSYTYMRNVNDLNGNYAKSFIFQTYARNYLSAWQYYSYLAIFLLTVTSLVLLFFHTSTKKAYMKGKLYEP